jgi:hypothetical protein
VLRDWALRVVPGAGVVSRSDSTALLIADGAAVDVTQRILGAITAHEARVTSGPVSSRQLIRDIATVFAEVEVLPPFALVADEGEGIALLLHGDLSAVIRPVDGAVEEISGRMSQTWVDRILTDPLEELCVGARSDSDVGIPFDLQVGVVPGAGIALSKAPISGVAPRREPERVVSRINRRVRCPRHPHPSLQRPRSNRLRFLLPLCLNRCRRQIHWHRRSTRR